MHETFLSVLLVPMWYILLVQRGPVDFLHMFYRFLSVLWVFRDAIPDDGCCSVRTQARGKVAGCSGVGPDANGYMLDDLRQISLWGDGSEQRNPYHGRYPICVLSANSCI